MERCLAPCPWAVRPSFSLRSHLSRSCSLRATSSWGLAEPTLATDAGAGLEGGPAGSEDETATTDALSDVAVDGLAEAQGPSSDAGSDAIADSGGEAGTGAPDAAAADGGDASDSGPPALLRPHRDLCSDFDQTTSPLGSGRARRRRRMGPTRSTRRTSSLHHTVSPRRTRPFSAPPGTRSRTSGSRSLAWQDESIIRFTRYLAKYDTVNNPAFTLAQLIVGSSGAEEFTLQLVLKGGEVSLVQVFTGTDGGQQQTSATGVGSLTTAEWATIDMLLDRRAASWTVSVSINGTLNILAQTAATPSNQNLDGRSWDDWRVTAVGGELNDVRQRDGAWLLRRWGIVCLASMQIR